MNKKLLTIILSFLVLTILTVTIVLFYNREDKRPINVIKNHIEGNIDDPSFYTKEYFEKLNKEEDTGIDKNTYSKINDETIVEKNFYKVENLIIDGNRATSIAFAKIITRFKGSDDYTESIQKYNFSLVKSEDDWKIDEVKLVDSKTEFKTN